MTSSFADGREGLVTARVEAEPGPLAALLQVVTAHGIQPVEAGRLRAPAPAILRANDELEKNGIAPIGPITFHSLRKTYASVRFACGDDLPYVAAQLAAGKTCGP